MRLTSSYIIKEIFPIFILGNFFLVFLLMLERLVMLADLFFSKNVPFTVIGQTIVYMLPSILANTIPLSCLFATLIAFSRLSSDSELVAMRAIGASIRTLITPAIVFGVLAGFICFSMNSYLAVKGTMLAYNNLNKIIEHISLNDLRENEIYTNLPSMRLFVKKKHDEFSFEDVILIRTDDDTVISAKQGRIFPTTSESLEMFFYDGRVTAIDDTVTSISFDSMSINIPLNIDFADAIDSVASTSMSVLIKEMFHNRAYAFELSKRFSMAVATIIMAALGLTLGIFSSRSTKSFGLLFGVLVAFLYNMTLLYIESSISKIMLPPLLMAWIPNVILLVLFVISYRRIAK